VARRHAERDPLGEFGHGQPPRSLKLSKDLSVDRIHNKDYCRKHGITA
jgi:hypothetical protein